MIKKINKFFVFFILCFINYSFSVTIDDFKDKKKLAQWEKELLVFNDFGELSRNLDNIDKLLFCSVSSELEVDNLQNASFESKKKLAEEIFAIKLKNPTFNFKMAYRSSTLNTFFGTASNFMNKIMIAIGGFYVLKMATPFYEPYIQNIMRKWLFKNSIKPTESTILFDNIYGYENIKKKLKIIIYKLKKQKKDKKLKKMDGVLFYGNSGNGKTYVAQALAHDADIPFFSIKASDLINDKGVVEDHIKLLFNKISSYVENNKIPVILFIDEIDLLIPARQQGKLLPEEKIILQDFLSLLDGQIPLEGVLLIANTNYIENIDTAILRKGRIGNHIEFANPTKEDIILLVKGFLKNEKIGLDEHFDLDIFAQNFIGQNVTTIKSSISSIKDYIVEKKMKLILTNELLEDYLKIFALY